MSHTHNNQAVKNVIIVGGGTAGWLSAALLAAQHKSGSPDGISISLVESSNIPSVGVGEGTWPTMKNTIQQIGIKEIDLFRHCHAAFKQGGKFVNWVHGNGDYYYHPFTFPLGYGRIDLAPYLSDVTSYASQSNFQHHICEAGLAPRALSEAEFQGPCNYAYHLDAGAFAELLKKHCIENLGVHHIIDTVEDSLLNDQGDIDSIILTKSGRLSGDFFIDCSGFASLLLGKKLNVPFISTKDVLLNDTAIAVQVPYSNDNDSIASHTIATAQQAGWTWDIGLPHRRGVGYAYASEFHNDSEAEKILETYLGASLDRFSPRKITFDPGHRQIFWKNNCVAIGLSAGFVEPLEATALMLIEISARYVSDNLPVDKSLMGIIANRFNQQMHYRWRRIIDFLKLHYMLTQRDEAYWKANTDPAHIPDSLKEDLSIWRYRGPINGDFDSAIELFPAASYQYVLYGMGFQPDFECQAYLYDQQAQAENILKRNQTLTQQLLERLPKHRDYIQRWLTLKEAA